MQSMSILKKIAAFLIMLPLTPTMANAERFGIEGDPSFKRPPPAVQRAVINDKNGAWSKDLFDECPLFGAPVRLSANGSNDGFIVSTKGCGGGSSAFPVWLVSMSGKHPRVVLSDAAIVLKIKRRKTKGLRDISVIRGSAGYCDEIIMRFNGSQYVKYTQKECDL